MNPPIPGTVVVYGAHFRRAGFGATARVWTLALHAAGVRVKVAPVDCDDPNLTGGLDDTDVALLRRLESTPLVPPVTAIFAYVPIYLWPRMTLPEPNLRIMLTSFDSSVNPAPPQPRYIYICDKMDQTWLVNEHEKRSWTRCGADPRRIHWFKTPHEWLDNPLLPPPESKAGRGKPFRFLHVSLFLPRRRLDGLLQAFYEEFRGPDEAELYLKMTYPVWHRHGLEKSKRDLANLVDSLRARTGSRAKVIVDNELGTRLGMLRLFDSCDTYVSSDLECTAPVAEAVIRKRPVIIGQDWGVEVPPQAWVVPSTQEMVPITSEMEEYVAHLKGTSFPALNVTSMREALRHFYELEDEPRRELVEGAYDFLHERYSLAATTPPMIAAILQGWEDKRRQRVEISSDVPTAPRPSAKPDAGKRFRVSWCGLHLFHGRPATVNREICLELMRRGHELSLIPANGPFQVEELCLKSSPKFSLLADRFYTDIDKPAEFTVCSRWNPVFFEHPAPRQVLLGTWWAGAIPVDWRKPISEYINEVWVPSQFIRENFLQGGVPENQIQVIPFGFDPAVFRPEARPTPLKTRKRFKFLFVGEATTRKGFDLLLLAYLKTFTARDDVCLVVKDMSCQDYYVPRGGSRLVRECLGKSNLPEVEYVDRMMDETELAGLYTACDCFVQPFRTAGFGLAILEAMACGLPVIATQFGGPLDFCDEHTACLLPSHKVRARSKVVLGWKVSGEQFHAEARLEDLQERLKEFYRGSSDGSSKAEAARERVHAQYTWSHVTDRIEERLTALQQAPPLSRALLRPLALSPNLDAAGSANVQPGAPTILVFAPFYNRSGYGVSARALVTAFHSFGLPVRIVPVDNVEDGIDDSDLALLKSIEQPKHSSPVVAIFFHVPTPAWLRVQLPPGSVRILYTNFDSSAQGNLPPSSWVEVCKAMDQVWLGTLTEASIFAQAGVPESKLKVVHCPHPWVGNPLLPPRPRPDAGKSRPFRFLSIAMFLPRRRWDTLIEAYLTEFKGVPDVELYLKVNYPSWHSVPGQPAADLRALIESLRAKTGSQAPIILDEDLGTRLGICRLIDSCDVYVSTDTTPTAPIAEAFVRGKIAVFPDGYGMAWPCGAAALVIPANPQLSRPMSREELLYQPHHHGARMPLLLVEDVRSKLRAAFDLPQEERQRLGDFASEAIEKNCGRPVLDPMLAAIDDCLKQKRRAQPSSVRAQPAKSVAQPVRAAADGSLRVSWEGTFLDFGSLSHVNRELTKALLAQPRIDLSRVGRDSLSVPAAQCPELEALARGLKPSRSEKAQITIRHAWPPDWAPVKGGALVVIQPWEYGMLPAEWVAQVCHVQQFWVPSEYVRQVYIRSGIPEDKVKVVPNGIDPERFRPDVEPMSLPTGKSFKFLFVGGTIHRKGADVLLKTYLENFTVSDDVCLVIKDFGGKSFYAGQTFEAQIRAAQSQPNAPEILYLNEELPPDSLPGLYRACDCLVHPYRGEGFALPVLEAMACGLPVIVTAGGATDDFAVEEFAYRIPATKKSIGNSVGDMKLVSAGWLLEPDAPALAARMKWVVEHRDDARATGLRASDHARREWTWDRAAQIAVERLFELQVRNETKTETGTGKSPERRNAAIVLPPCALVGHIGPARELLSRKKPRDAWEATRTALQARPFHPEGYLLLAEIAQAVGDSASARRCAEHARRLAPSWKPARRFLNQRLKGNGHADWLVLPDSVVKPQSPVAHRLSVCLIVKNEEIFIARCLSSVRGFADQIVVVDTGSTDRTVEIAKEHSAEVHSFAWCDDFSAARNVALEHVRGDWVLVLDADEELTAKGCEVVRQEMDAADVMAYRLPIVDVGNEEEGHSYVPRLFRNAPGLFYVGRIHEQVFSSVEVRREEWGLENRFSKATLLHHGYTKQVNQERDKNARNLRLLELAVAEMPNEPNLLMNYGLELARAGKTDAALLQYQEAFRALQALPQDQIVPELRESLLAQLCTQLMAAKKHEELVQMLHTPLALRGGLTATLHFGLGLAYMELKNYREAADQFRQCIAKRDQPSLTPVNRDIRKAGPHHCLAVCLMHLREFDAADEAFQQALAGDPQSRRVRFDFAAFLAARGSPVDALKQLHALVSEKADELPLWLLGGQIALSQPDFIEFACDWTGEAMKLFPQDPQIRSQRAEALLLRGKTGEALELWRDATEARNVAARLICEVVTGKAIEPLRDGEVTISREFLAWYRRLVHWGASATVFKLNENVHALRNTLPTAVAALEAAFSEVRQPTTV